MCEFSGNTPDIFIVAVFESSDQSGGMDIFRVLGLPVHENGLSLHLFASLFSLVEFYNYLCEHLYLGLFLESLIRFIPRSLLHFVIVIKGTCLTIVNADFLILRSTIDLLVFYPAALPRLFLLLNTCHHECGLSFGFSFLIIFHSLR